MASVLGSLPSAFAERATECHATPEGVAAAMRSQFEGWFVAYNRGADSYGINTLPLCSRIHPYDVSEANRRGDVPSFCAQDAHGFYDWLCYFDTAYSLDNNWPERVTHEEVKTAKSVTEVSLWIGGPFAGPPPDVEDFVLNPGAYPDWEATTPLPTSCGPIKKFNGGIVYNATVPGLPEQFQIEKAHAFTYNCGAIFDQFELETGSFYSFRLQICSDIPVRPGAPTKDSSLGGNDGWDNVRVETEEECWWDRSMIIEIVDRDDGPDFCCTCGD